MSAPSELTQGVMMSDFGKAFRAARAAGKDTFKWNGSSYNTKLASDTPTPPKRPAEATESKPAKETKWADPGLKEGGKPRDDEPSKPTMDTTGWRDPGDIENKNRRAGYAFRKGGMVKGGAATIGVTRSNRDYGKKAYAKGGAVKKGC